MFRAIIRVQRRTFVPYPKAYSVELQNFNSKWKDMTKELKHPHTSKPQILANAFRDLFAHIFYCVHNSSNLSEVQQCYDQLMKMEPIIDHLPIDLLQTNFFLGSSSAPLQGHYYEARHQLSAHLKKLHQKEEERLEDKKMQELSKQTSKLVSSLLKLHSLNGHLNKV